jgi:3-methyladenine DNA glycosylase AlkD
MLVSLIKKIQSEKNLEKAKILQKFFKTGEGEYGEGDFFLGISLPKQKNIAKEHVGLNLANINFLLKSKVHEYRMIAVLILLLKYEKGDENEKARIFNFYLENISYINNWDLVDVSAPKIIGNFLFEKEKEILYNLAKSENLWKKRIAIVSTFYFIKKNKFNETLKISEILLKDKNDLIHKAVGWMLREVGKENKEILVNFLRQYYKIMPRTMLRYSIEKFPEIERKKWLLGKF